MLFRSPARFSSNRAPAKTASDRALGAGKSCALAPGAIGARKSHPAPPGRSGDRRADARRGLRQAQSYGTVDATSLSLRQAASLSAPKAFSKNYLVHDWHQALTCVCKTRKRNAIHLRVSGPVISLKAPKPTSRQLAATDCRNSIGKHALKLYSIMEMRSVVSAE